LRDTDPKWMGFYFDPCHATIEGGSAGWKVGFHRLSSRLKMVAVKDFYWEKQGGKWNRRVCPLGEGMVKYPEFFKLLAASGFSGPISLHIEYEITAPTESARREKVLAAIERDYKTLRQLYDGAYG
jgi:sugar phosphate isomerase/epimerase